MQFGKNLADFYAEVSRLTQEKNITVIWTGGISANREIISKGLQETSQLVFQLQPDAYEEQGKALAKKLQGKVPVMYSSTRNQPIAYNWRIKFHESAKIPAFHNVFPELNHNEMTGFDVIDSTKKLSGDMVFMFLQDSNDNSRIQKRMEALQKQLEAKGLPIIVEYTVRNGISVWPYFFVVLILLSSFAIADNANFNACFL